MLWDVLHLRNKHVKCLSTHGISLMIMESISQIKKKEKQIMNAWNLVSCNRLGVALSGQGWFSLNLTIIKGNRNDFKVTTDFPTTKKPRQYRTQGQIYVNKAIGINKRDPNSKLLYVYSVFFFSLYVKTVEIMKTFYHNTVYTILTRKPSKAYEQPSVPTSERAAMVGRPQPTRMYPVVIASNSKYL